MWQNAQGEFDAHVKQVLKRGNNYSRNIYVVFFMVIAIIIFISLGHEKRTEAARLVDRFPPSSFSYFTKALKIEVPELHNNEDYLIAVNELNADYQTKYIAVVLLYIFVCAIICLYYAYQDRKLKDQEILFCNGVCIERDWREKMIERHRYTKCHLSLRLENDDIVKLIKIEASSGSDINIDDNIILIKIKGIEDDPIAYHYRMEGERIVIIN